MKKNSKPKWPLIIIFIVIAFILINRINLQPNSIVMEVVSPENDDTYQLYYDTGNGFNETDSIRTEVRKNNNTLEVINFPLPEKQIKSIRFDPGSHKGNIIIKSIKVNHNFYRLGFNLTLLKWKSENFSKHFKPLNHISNFNEKDGNVYIIASDNDPYFVLKDNLYNVVIKKIIIIKICLYISFLILFSLLTNFTKVSTLLVSSVKAKANKINGFIKKYRRIIINYISPSSLIKNDIVISILCISPVSTGFLYVYLFGVNIPFWDQWELVSLFEKINTGNLTFQDLFSQHNEHRIFFPRIIMLIIAFLTGYNNKSEMYFIEFLLLISLIICFLVIKKSFNINIKSIPYWFIPVPFLIFTLKQYENMLWGFQIGFVMVQTMSLITIYFIFLLSKTELKKFKYIYFISSLTSGIITSFSSIMGLFIWPSGMIQIVISQFKKKDKIVYTLTWSITGIITWIIYFINYHKPCHHPDMFIFLYNPIFFSKYLFTCIGTALFWYKNNAFLGGTLFFFILLKTLYYLYKNKRLKDNSFWIGGLIFSLLTVISISIGRCGLGIEQSMSSRYITFSIILFISLYLILIDLNMQKKHILIKSLLILLIFLILISIPYSYTMGFYTGKNKKNYLEATIPSLLNYGKAKKEDMEKLYPSSEILKQRAAFLKKNNMSIFNRDFLENEYPEYTFIQKKENSIKDSIIEKIELNKYGKWTDNVWPGTTPEDTFVEYILCSRADSDRDTGQIKSKSFKISAPSYIVMYIMYGPDKKCQISGIDINNDDKIDIYYNNKSCIEHIWYRWYLDLTDYSDKNIKIIVEDNGDGWGQWIGVSQPILYKKTDK